MSLVNIGQAIRPYLFNTVAATGLTFGVVVLEAWTSKAETSLLRHLAVSVATAVGVFFTGKQIGYSTLPIAVGLVGQAVFLYANEDSEEGASPLLAAIAISTVAATALQKFGFLPQILL